MIAQKRLEALIINGDVSISYAFARLDGAEPVYLGGEQFVDPREDDLPATKMFRRNFFGDRLRLTLGPIVMTHCRRYRRGRPLYKNRPGYFDLRAMENRLIIEPDEILSISTNERIRLRAGLGAYILPRLRNVDSGLLYVPSYIDPYWDGILQAVIVNLTSNRQELRLCEGLAICRFYEILGDVPQAVADAFPGKSHHFGQTWPKILEEDGEPFPRRKAPLISSPLQRLRQGLMDILFEYGKSLRILGYVGGTLAIVVLGGSLWNQLQRLEKVQDKADQSVQRLDKLEQVTIPKFSENVEKISKQVARSGTATLSFKPDAAVATYSFEVVRPREATSTVWVTPLVVDASRYDTAARIERLPNDDSRVAIIIEIRRAKPGPEERVQVQWMLVY